MEICWEKGLVPAIAQDAKSGEVLMLAFMDEKAFELTKQTGFAHYFSRSKNRIWKKGESSGHTQKVIEIIADCDRDAILLKVEQSGVACHTGEKSCFFNKINGSAEVWNSKNQPELNYDILDKLYHTCLERKLAGNSENSYVAKLYKKGANAYLKKICEEAGEFGFALKDALHGAKGEHKQDEPKYDVVYEGADILFHMIVALADLNIHPEQILNELKRREGLSGISEKNSRKE